MEENTKKETTEKDSSPVSDQAEQNSPRKGGLTGWMDSINSRSAIVMLIAGLYLAYLGWGLCKGYIDKAEGSGIGFFCAGAAFILIGVFMAFAGGRVTLKAQNQKKAVCSHQTLTFCAFPIKAKAKAALLFSVRTVQTLHRQ